MERTKRIAAKVLAGGLLATAALSMPGLAYADTEVHASNSCTDCDNETGDASAQNSNASFTGQNTATGTNVQAGDNETDSDQDANAESGTASSGQVIGVADDGSGDVRIVASNHNEDVNNSTGKANALNVSALFTGQANIGGLNFQAGDNETDASQASDATSGDAISGQVIGVV